MSRHLSVGLAIVVLCAFGILVDAGGPREAAGAVRSLPGFTVNALMPFDDGSTSAVPLLFTVNFLGLPFSTVFVNNNGNITFDAPLSTFTPMDLTSTQRQIIAPFWADVDTRGFVSLGNIVTYGTDLVNGRTAFGVTWTTVGYFNSHTDKRNTFQLVLIDRSDTGSGNFDIEFNYEQIRWETGDASGGLSGLGGSSARVGFSNGTGIPGTFFELPGSAIPGSFLDSSPTGGLVANRRNSPVDGRYLFVVREGTVLSQFQLTVGKLGNGNGTVTGPGIECGTVCTGSFNPGTRLQATAAPGSSFAGWGGACGGTSLCVLGMSADTTLTARFVKIPKGVGVQTGGANADSVNPVVSGNGQFVAYESTATTLTSDCTTAGRQIYLRDRATGVITCISRSPNGLPGNGPSMLPAISADGQIIAFQSTAANLASPCGAGTSQIFVHDRTTGTTTCASVAIGGGTAGNLASQQAALSADGRFVAFRSLAGNLGSCGNSVGQIFVRDRQAGATSCVSLAGGVQGTGPSANPVLSGDGRFVAFDSTATNLAIPCISSGQQIFVRDRTGGVTTCESVSPSNGQGDAPSLAPALDASGNVLAWESTATNLADPCADGVFSQIFVRDRTTGITSCASVTPDGSPGDGPSTKATLSANGGRLAFVSRATNLFSSGVPAPSAFTIRQPPSDTDQVLGSDIGATGSEDGLSTSATETLSESGSGDLGAASSSNPALSADGSVAVFDSTAQNLTSGAPPVQNVLSVQATGRARFTAPAQGTQLNLDAPTVVTINWTVVGGAALYGVEFTGANRPFANPNAAGPDPVNGFGGAGGAFAAPGTSVTGALDPSVPPGVYQIRVLGLSAGLQPIGTFSDALTLVLGFSQRPAFISPASGSVFGAGASLTLAWTPVPGAVQYGMEFTGANRQFANPNGATNDPVNGFGGAGGGSLVTGTGFTVTLPAGIPPGSYQVRVIGLTAALAPVGVFSDAVTVVFP